MKGRLTPVALVSFALAIMSADAAAQSLDDRYRVAAGHYRAERWELAIEELTALLDSDPAYGDGAARYFLGEALLQVDRRDDAVAAYRACRAATMTADLQQRAAFRLAEAAILDRRFDAALDELTSFRKTHGDTPLDAYTLPYLGEAQFESGQFAAAEESFRSALARYPAGPLVDACRLGLARTFARQGRNNEAIAACREMIDADGANGVDARMLLGAVQLECGQFAEARDAFEQLIEKRPGRRLAAQAGAGLGQSLVQLGDADGAIAALAPWLADEGVGRDAEYWTALAHKTALRWTEAADALERLITEVEDAPRPPAWLASAYMHAGEARMQNGETDRAARAFETLIARWPASDAAAQALAQLAHIAHQSGDHAKVAQRAGELRERFPDAAESWTHARRVWAASLLVQGRYGQAVELLKPAFADDAPAAPAADERLWAFALAGAGEHGEALAAVARLEAAGEASADVLLVEATARRSLGEFATAAEILAPLCTDSADEATRRRALSQSVICLVELGDLETAQRQVALLCADPGAAELAIRPVEAVADALAEDGAFAEAAELHHWLANDERTLDVRRRALLRRAWCLVRAGNAEAALEPLARAEEIAEGATLAETLSLRATALEALERWDAALATYDRIARDCADSSRADEMSRRQAQLLARRSLPGDAAAILVRLATKSPPPANLDAILYEWAWAEQRRGDAAKAAELFRRLAAEHAESRYWPDAAYRVAEADVAIQRYDEAARTLAQLARSDHGGLLRLLPHVLLLEAKIAIEQSNWREALGPLEKLLSDCPTAEVAPSARFWRAETLFRLGQLARADEAYRRVADEAATFEPPPSWAAVTELRRAEICAQKQDWAGALERAETIAVRFPGFSHQFEADYVIGRAHAAAARFDQARDAYRRVVQSAAGRATETAAMAQWMIGETYMHQREHAAALREYLKVEILYDFPEWQAAALLQAGKCAESLDDPGSAQKTYSRLLSQYADTKFAGEARERLAALDSVQAAKTRAASRRPADTGAQK